MNIVAIIPARGGSKGIPKKNIVKLVGRPLLEYTIKEAKRSKFIDKIILSTDNQKIANVAKACGAEVPFLRPKKISTDFSPTIETVKHAIKFLITNQAYVPDIILLLQPTSPLRTAKLMDRSIRILKSSNASSVIAVSKIKKHPYTSFWLKSGFLKPFKRDFKKFSLRQKNPDLYFPTGAIYTFWYNTIKKYNTIYGPKMKPLIVNEDELNIDIDTNYDLFIAEMAMRYWKNFQKNIK